VEGHLFHALDAETDSEIASQLRATITTLLSTGAPTQPSYWLKVRMICRRQAYPLEALPSFNSSLRDPTVAPCCAKHIIRTDGKSFSHASAFEQHDDMILNACMCRRVLEMRQFTP